MARNRFSDRSDALGTWIIAGTGIVVLLAEMVYFIHRAGAADFGFLATDISPASGWCGTPPEPVCPPR